MSTARSTAFERLQLKNYRQFAELDIRFEPDLTVVVAENGAGKTSILDAVALALADFPERLRFRSRSHDFAPSDVRRTRDSTGKATATLPTMLDASASMDGRPMTWRRERTSLEDPPVEVHEDSLTACAGALVQGLVDHAERRRPEPPTLPVVAYYGTGRDWSRRRRTEATKRNAAKEFTTTTGAYLGCLTPSTRYLHFAVWLERIILTIAAEGASGIPSPHRPKMLLSVVRGAVDAVLEPTGWHSIDWDPVSGDIVASHAEYGRMPVSLLSDGIRNMTALVADLAHRAVRLNPQFGDETCRITPGIVLIDEVDLHLHPAWQQTIVESLRGAFPAMQFILSTHSHLVASTLPGASLRIIASDGAVSRPALETQGYDSPFALGVVFGVNSSPPIEIARQLSRYRALLEQGQGQGEDAQALHARLVQHFGAQHPAMVAADGLRRLQDFKARMAAKREGA